MDARNHLYSGAMNTPTASTLTAAPASYIPGNEGAPPTAAATQGRLGATALDLLPPVLAGLIAVLVSYAGPFLLVLQAAQVGHLSAAQLSSWVWAISIGAGLCSVFFSWRHRIPVVCAWNTPGAALLVGAMATLPYTQVVGGYVVAAALLWLVGRSAAFERVVAAIPQSLCAALLAGILLRFGVQVYAQTAQASTDALWLVGVLFATYLAGKRWAPRYAIVLTLSVGVLLWATLGWGAPAQATASAALQWQLTQPVWTTPEFSLAALVSVGLPLAVLCLTGQQLPGLAVLRTAHFPTPTRALVGGSSLVSLLLAPWGAHGVNLAAITAAICTGEEAHRDPAKRWVAGAACGAFYLLIGSFAAVLTQALVLLPPVLIGTVAGLALLGAIQGGLVQGLAVPAEREAALVTFVVTASNVGLLGLGSACWGLVLGGLTYWALRPAARKSL